MLQCRQPRCLRHCGIPAFLVGGQMRYFGVWAPGNDGYYLWANVTWDSFRAKWEEVSAQGLRLVDLSTEVVNGEVRYTGAWRAGTGGHYLWVNADWSDFVAKWRELAPQGLRLTVIDSHSVNGQRRYAGVWRPGHRRLLPLGQRALEQLRGQVARTGRPRLPPDPRRRARRGLRAHAALGAPAFQDADRADDSSGDHAGPDARGLQRVGHRGRAGIDRGPEPCRPERRRRRRVHDRATRPRSRISCSATATTSTPTTSRCTSCGRRCRRSMDVQRTRPTVPRVWWCRVRPSGRWATRWDTYSA